MESAHGVLMRQRENELWMEAKRGYPQEKPASEYVEEVEGML